MKQKPSLKQVVEKNFPEFCDEVASLSAEQIDARLAQLAKDNEELTSAKEADEALEKARAQVVEFSAPYRDGKKAIALKSSYLVGLLKDRGGA